MKKRKKNVGFTLIEIIVVVSSIGLVMLVVVGSLLQIMKVQNQNEAISKLSESGSWILSELRQNMFNSNGKVVCGSGNLSVGITSLMDSLSTVLNCSVSNNKIASVSGSVEKKLNGNNISVVSCNDFVLCDVDSRFVTVTFNFGIGTSVSGIGSTRNFSTTVTVRNQE